MPWLMDIHSIGKRRYLFAQASAIWEESCRAHVLLISIVVSIAGIEAGRG
jgi:hypothetical protein